MKRMIAFEIKKLWNHKILIGTFLLLLLVSGMVFHLYEQNQPAYRYVYLGKEQYESFIQGEIEVDADGFYTADVEKQFLYKENYEVFLSEMESRAQQTILLLANSDDESFVCDNAEKTCEDYADLKDVLIITDNCYGIMELTKYDFGIYFVIAFITVLAYFLFFDERKNGLLLLVKGTKNGHIPLISVKIILMIAGAVVFALIQELLHVAMIGYYYGYGDLSRSIQSVPEFRNCSLPISVGESILMLVVVRIWIAIIVSVIVSMISIAVRNELLAVLSMVIFLVVEVMLCEMLSITGSLNVLKCVNPFYFWNMLDMLATYLNLNILGNAVGKGVVALIVSSVILLICTIAGVQSFRYRYQIRTTSRLDKVLLWWREKTAFLWRNVNLLWFEFYKTLVQQKRIALVLLIVILCVLNVNKINEEKYYDNAYEATYNSYLKKISGEVTDESIAFVNSEKAYVEDLQNRLESLEDPEGKDYGLALQLASELSMKEGAVIMLEAQLNASQEMPGSIYDKYMINEGAYLDMFCDADLNVIWWCTSISFVIIWLSGVYPADRNKEVFSLVRSTKNGREQLDVRKNTTVAIGLVIFCGASQIVELVELHGIDGLRCLAKPLAEFTSVSLTSNITIGGFFLLTMVLRVITMVIITSIMLWVSRKTLNEMVTNIVGVGFAGVIAFICISFNISIGGWLLNLMYV